MIKDRSPLLKRVLAIAVSFMLLVSVLVFPETSAKSAIGELQDKYDEAQQQIESNQDKMEANNSEKLKNEEKMKILSEEAEAIGAQLTILENKMAQINKEIYAIDTQIDKLDKNIKDTQNKVKSTEKDIQDTKDLIAKRLSASYMAGDASWLQMLLEADSLSSLLLRMQLVTNVTEQDNELVDHLEKETKKLEKLQKSLEKDKKDCEEQRAKVKVKYDELEKEKRTLAAKQDEFNKNYYEYSQIVAELDRNSQIYKDLIEENRRKKAEFGKEIDRLIAQGSQSGQGSTDDYYNDGEMMWPVPYKNSYISAGYGYYDPDEDGNPDFHPAIDIVVRENGQNVSYGKKIVAAQGGKVIARGYSNIGGNYVTIDHGNGLRTYYGHCSVVHVSQGAIVKKGQHIADIGATGYVTGPHVHFQVMQVDNGYVYKLNPLDFVIPPNY